MTPIPKPHNPKPLTEPYTLYKSLKSPYRNPKPYINPKPPKEPLTEPSISHISPPEGNPDANLWDNLQGKPYCSAPKYQNKDYFEAKVIYFWGRWSVGVMVNPMDPFER